MEKNLDGCTQRQNTGNGEMELEDRMIKMSQSEQQRETDWNE